MRGVELEGEIPGAILENVAGGKVLLHVRNAVNFPVES